MNTFLRLFQLPLMGFIYSFKKKLGFFSQLFLLLCFLCMGQGLQAQINLLKGGNMESNTGWTVYNLNSTTPATLEFNYAVTKPKLGSNGCLRVTCAQPANVLLWQKITLKGGESYTVDGAIKTNNVASFWAEINVSVIAPVEGSDYLPSDNTDVLAGFSTWAGCGPNVDGSFVGNACTGKKTFVAPGVKGANVEVYFALKTGSMAAPLPNPLEVLLDELKLLTRDVGIGNDITSVSLGTLQTTSITIPNNLRAVQLRSSLAVSPYASFKIMNASNMEVASQAVVDNTMEIVVTAENGISKTYTIVTNTNAIATQIINNYTGTVSAYQNKNYTFTGSDQVTITDASAPLKGSMIDLQSEDVWLYFPTIKPSEFNTLYLGQIIVNGAAAVVDQNIRLAQYLDGTMMISHPKTYLPLQLYNGDNLSGTSQKLGVNTYYRTTQLGTLNNAAKSFVLKKGYMATLAQNETGTGISQVYVAYNTDIVVNKLPTGLYNDVSFVKVVPWRWTTKKGWTNGVDAAKALKCTWNYDWDNVATSTLDVEYIPMRHNLNWNSYDNINNKINSTHSLGFNEPDRTDQANISVATAIAAWPEMLKSGLRVGSPAPSDAGAGLTWLYQFMDKCDSLKYRVDFVTVHWYKGGQTAKQFYDWLKAVHVRTKRPIWITEWNNGANWTCCKPTYAQDAQTISEMINMMDTASFVERYSLYEWVEDTRQMFFQSPLALTPAGVQYRNNSSPLAYNPNKVTSIVTEVDERILYTSNNGIMLYPNPSKDLVQIQSEGNLLSVSVYSLRGELLYTQDIDDHRNIDIGGIPTGMYLITLTDGKQVWQQKLFKE